MTALNKHRWFLRTLLIAIGLSTGLWSPACLFSNVKTTSECSPFEEAQAESVSQTGHQVRLKLPRRVHADAPTRSQVIVSTGDSYLFLTVLHAASQAQLGSDSLSFRYWNRQNGIGRSLLI